MYFEIKNRRITLWLKTPKFEDVKYPRVGPVPEGIHRPFWSVMIPTYNCKHYLEEALNSVLEQDPGPDEMQIEVIDDCSTENDPRAIVRGIGENRISYYRQPHNVGISANWNTCIKRAHGHWVHILHQDDIVLPGFYTCFGEALKREATIGAAFCRHIFMDEDGHWQSLSLIERGVPGILSNWLERIAVMQLIQTPSVVVRRSVYEELGGFHAKMFYAVDWEMWKRIAAHYPVWYEPQPLACYRVHSSSATSRLIKSGANIVDCRRAIEISCSYLPDTTAGELSVKAREYWALHAINVARQMLTVRDIGTAAIQIREAFKCSHSLKVIKSVVHLFVDLQWQSVFRLVVRLLAGERGTMVIKRVRDHVLHRG